MGMAVAVAARMEAAAEPGTVLVTEDTYRLVEAQFEWQPLGEIMVKGVSQPVSVYRPLAPRAEAERQLPVQPLQYSIPLVGREAEFQALKGRIEDLFDGRGGIVMLTGDKGAGKTFLAKEVYQYFIHRGALLTETPEGNAPSTPSLTWLRGRCRSYGQTWPYSMWLDLLQDWLGVRPDESKDETRAGLRRRAEALWGDDFAEHYPYLATFLSLPLEETFSEKIRHLNGEGLRQRFFLAVRSWVEALGKVGPLVLTFSDVHWADTSSLNLLRDCLPLCDSEALLWVLVFRSDRDAPTWDFRHYVETEYPHRLTLVDLPPLTEAQSSELIGWLIGPDTLPEETRALILANAEGNPYYVQELIQSLIAGGVLIQDSETGQWRVTRTVTTLDLPDSLQRLLRARIDRLSPAERSVLQIAAVIGPVFWLNVLESLTGAAHPLKAELPALQRALLIQESGRVPELGMQYLFSSALIRDAAYESLLSAQRAAYHLKAAECLESLVNPEGLTGYYGMLAYHYHGAGNPRKELFYTLLAAEQARKIYANAEALQHYTQALELLERLEAQANSNGQSRALLTQRFEVLNGRRAVLYQMGQIEAYRTDTQALLPLARQMTDDPAWLIDALLAQAEAARDTREELTPGLPMAQEALTLARQLGDRNREMFSLMTVAGMRFTLKDPTWQEMAEHALTLARQLGDLRMEVNLLLGIGGAYGMDNLPRSREYLEAALSRSETLNDKATELPLLNAVGQQFERDGDYYRQLTDYEQKRLRLSREIGHRIAEGNALMFCGQIESLYLGDYEAGLALEQEALHIWESITDRLFPLLRIAQIRTAQGKLEEAVATLELARPIGEHVVGDIGRAGLGLVTAILYNALGDEARLRMTLDVASRIRQMAADNLVSRQYHMAAACEATAAHLGLARRLVADAVGEAERQAHRQQALESSRIALNLYQEFGFVQIIECTSEEILFRHSQALAANECLVEAADYLQRAYDEMMRKHALIPANSPFRSTYLENIALHREIRAAHAAKM
jgi:predicted GNAT family N-acyltransferase